MTGRVALTRRRGHAQAMACWPRRLTPRPRGDDWRRPRPSRSSHDDVNYACCANDGRRGARRRPRRRPKNSPLLPSRLLGRWVAAARLPISSSRDSFLPPPPPRRSPLPLIPRLHRRRKGAARRRAGGVAGCWPRTAPGAARADSGVEAGAVRADTGGVRSTSTVVIVDVRSRSSSAEAVAASSGGRRPLLYHRCA